MKAEETIKKCILSCPLIFKNKLEVYNHLFLTNGNGFKWVNGELIDDSLNNDYSLEDSIYDILLDDFKYDLLTSTVELYSEYDDEATDKIIERFKSFNEKNFNLIKHVLSIDKLMDMSLDECEINNLYPLCKYACILNIPDNITDDWKECVKKFYNFLMKSTNPMVNEYIEKYSKELKSLKDILT